MNVLLIDINKQSRYRDFVPLALLRLASFHNKENIELIKAGQTPKAMPDLMYFSLIFLFKRKRDLDWILTYKKKYPKANVKIGGLAPTLKPDFYLKHLNENEIFLGRDLELEKLKPNFDIIKKDYSYGFTTRGCYNKCEWCVVPKLEGHQVIVNNWQTQIDTTKKKFYCFDNNIFACGSQHLDDVLTFCDKNNIKIDFNQGLDAELFYKNPKIREVFLKHNGSYLDIRFAWDSHRVDKAIKFTFDFIEENKIRCSGDKLIYMLYDNKDNKPEDVYDRIKYILNVKGYWKIKMMRFKNIDNGQCDRNWGGLGDLFAETIKLSRIGIINNQTFYKYLFNGNLNSYIQRATYCREYDRNNYNINSNELIKFCKTKLKES